MKCLVSISKMIWKHRETESSGPYRVLILTSNNQVGGITSAAIALSQSLREDFKVDIAYFSTDNRKEKSIEKWSLIKTPKIAEYSKLFKFVFRLMSLMRYLRTNKFDFIICQDPSTSLISHVSLFINSNVKIIGMCHVPNNLLTKIDKQIIKIIYPKLDRIVVPSEYISRELNQLSNKLNSVVIPNSLSEKITSCTWPRVQGLNPGSYIFLGRLEEEKNPKMILEMAKIDQNNTYVVCGDGSQGNNLKNIAKELKLKNISFLGYQDASRILNIGSVVIIPSLTESFGIVAIEAWLHGIPTLVSSSSDGILEMLRFKDLGLNLDLNAGISKWTENANKLSKQRISDRTIIAILETYHASAQLNKWREKVIYR